MDVSYYLYIEEDLILPILKNENENVLLQFKLLDQTAFLTVSLNGQFIFPFRLRFIRKPISTLIWSSIFSSKTFLGILEEKAAL